MVKSDKMLRLFLSLLRNSLNKFNNTGSIYRMTLTLLLNRIFDVKKLRFWPFVRGGVMNAIRYLRSVTKICKQLVVYRF